MSNTQLKHEDLTVFQDLPRRNSTDVKKSWRQVMIGVRENGSIAIMNHKDIEAVIVSPDRYQFMMEVISKLDQNKEKVLEELTRRFDQELASIQSPSANTNVNSLFATPSHNKSTHRPKAGKSY